MKVLLEQDWHARRERHQTRVRRWIEPRLRRASRGQKHPGEDFLFEYYANRPARLLRWHPGIGVALEGETARQYLCQRDYHQVEDGITAEIVGLSPQRLESIRWLQQMLRCTTERPGFFGCFGLHEWAMVYQTDAIRHAEWRGPRCTHYDAFRFFTTRARPLNRYQPTRATSTALEQPACLHANMDLYKWAFELAPFTASELVADCFELARAIRELDMRASPYDLTALGYKPVPIEKPEGRVEYEALQLQFAIRAAPLRKRLIATCEQILEKTLPSDAGSKESAPAAARCE
jgi:hypothetical protein